MPMSCCCWPGFRDRSFGGTVGKYVLIGLGLVKTGGISGLKAFQRLLATAVVLVLMVYALQYMMRF
jgi:hypothetical protein